MPPPAALRPASAAAGGHLSLGGAAPVFTPVRRRHREAGEERRGLPPVYGGCPAGGAVPHPRSPAREARGARGCGTPGPAVPGGDAAAAELWQPRTAPGAV